MSINWKEVARAEWHTRKYYFYLAKEALQTRRECAHYTQRIKDLEESIAEMERTRMLLFRKPLA